MTGRPVQVVVVAYGRADLLREALVPLAGSFAVHVVDNSSDADVARVCVAAGVRYTDAQHNAGFAAGVNIALREILTGPPADVLLLNPDAVVTADDVQRLAAALHRDHRTGMATPHLLHADGTRQRELWPFPSPWRAWLEALGLGGLNRAEDFAVGTVLLLRWEALQRVGLFDERFFLYAEETDWQRQARRHGWRPCLAADAVARHAGAATSPDSSRRDQLFHAGTETYVRKWFGASGWHAYRAAAWCGAVVRGALMPGERGAAARRRARLYARGPRRVAGFGRA